jgi:hypothetical protein
MANVRDLYPIAIIEDRYSGVYSGGGWLAIANADMPAVASGEYMPCVSWCLENGPHGDDTEAMVFWHDPPPWIAVGNTPDAALAALRAKMEPARV